MINKKVFVTLLSSLDYLLAVLVLNQSLKNTNSKYPLIVCVTEPIHNNKIVSRILEEEDIQTRVIEPLFYIDETNMQSNIKNTASKIQIFNLMEFDKIVYIDADCLIISNIDDLFNYPNGAILYHGDKNLLSGLFVIEPKLHSYHLYEFLITHYPDTDGGLIGKLFFPAYTDINYQIPRCYLDNGLDIPKGQKVIHYQNNKPFLLKTIAELITFNKYPAYALYFQYMLPYKEKYKNYNI